MNTYELTNDIYIKVCDQLMSLDLGTHSWHNLRLAPTARKSIRMIFRGEGGGGVIGPRTLLNR